MLQYRYAFSPQLLHHTEYKPRWLLQERVVRVWFLLGYFVGVVTVLSSWILLIPAARKRLLGCCPEFAIHSNSVLVLPGVNRPLSDFVYSFLGLGLALFVHEGGHAAAATSYGISVNAVTFFCLLGVAPGAYVWLNAHDFSQVSLSAKAQVILAGIWHNLLLCGLIYFLWWHSESIPVPLWSNNGAGATVAGFTSVDGILKNELAIGSIIHSIVTPDLNQRVYSSAHLAWLFQSNLRENGLVDILSMQGKQSPVFQVDYIGKFQMHFEGFVF